jgi:hypothetical protein
MKIFSFVFYWQSSSSTNFPFLLEIPATRKGGLLKREEKKTKAKSKNKQKHPETKSQHNK